MSRWFAIPKPLTIWKRSNRDTGNKLHQPGMNRDSCEPSACCIAFDFHWLKMGSHSLPLYYLGKKEVLGRASGPTEPVLVLWSEKWDCFCFRSKWISALDASLYAVPSYGAVMLFHGWLYCLLWAVWMGSMLLYYFNCLFYAVPRYLADPYGTESQDIMV